MNVSIGKGKYLHSVIGGLLGAVLGLILAPFVVVLLAVFIIGFPIAGLLGLVKIE